MATNYIPQTYSALMSLAEDAADGAQQLAATVGLLHNTEAAIRADISTLGTAESAVLAKRVEKNGAAVNLRTADSNGKAFLALFVRNGKIVIAPEWTMQWEQAGFADGSLALPRTQDERFTTLGKVRDFLATNPGLEYTDAARPALDTTAALAATRYDAVSTARSAVNLTNAQNGATLVVRDAALEALRRRLTGLREELAQVLEDDDSNWYAFGFNRPADPETPGVPDAVVVTPGAAGSGVLIVDWNDARRATGSKVRALLAGAAEPLEFGLFEGSQAVITLTPGAVATITVVAHNAHGYGAPSPAVQATAP